MNLPFEHVQSTCLLHRYDEIAVIYLYQGIPGSDEKWMISSKSGEKEIWAAHDGREESKFQNEVCSSRTKATYVHKCIEKCLTPMMVAELGWAK